MIKINLTDKNNKAVHVGDEFWAYMITPTLYPPTKVKVVSDTSEENLIFDRDYDVEDEKGNRLWNAYVVIKNDDRVQKGVSRDKYHARRVMEWSKEYDFKTRKFI